MFFTLRNLTRNATKNTGEVLQAAFSGSKFSRKTVTSATEKMARPNVKASDFTQEELDSVRAMRAAELDTDHVVYPKGLEGIKNNGGYKLEAGFPSLTARYMDPGIEGAAPIQDRIIEDALSVAGVTAAAVVGLKVTQGATNLLTGGPTGYF